MKLTVDKKRMDNIRSRIEKLPKYVGDVIKTKRKNDANIIIKTFQNAIENNNIGVDALKPLTIESKRKLNYSKPETPLYAKGKNEKRSYINMLYIQETQDGYTIRQKNHKHWKSKLTLRQLFLIHEYGTIIKRGNKLIRIPARSIFSKSYDRALMMQIDNKQVFKEIQDAKAQYIVSGHDERFKKIMQRLGMGVNKSYDDRN